MVTSLLTDLVDQMVGDIATDRELDEAVIRTAIDNAPIGDKEAIEQGFVDELLYGDEITARVDEATDKAVWIPVARYIALTRPAGPSGLDRAMEAARSLGGQEPEVEGEPIPRIAVVRAVGAVMLQESEGVNPLAGGGAMNALTVSLAIRQAAEDPAVRAIVLRIDSPGGSVTASEMILRAVRVARETHGKPVIVSMSNVAGSGGYWIAAAADRILAQPGTLTGSIGVIGGKPHIAELSERLGVNWGRITVGDNAAMLSIAQGFTDSERAALTRFIDQSYEAFLARVAEGRNMDVEAVRAVAGGRVWTGRQAVQNGLVDELGGLDRALVVARELAEIAPEEEVDIVNLPRPKPPLQRLRESLPFFGSFLRVLAGIGAVAENPSLLSRPAGAWMTETGITPRSF